MEDSSDQREEDRGTERNTNNIVIMYILAWLFLYYIHMSMH